MHEQLIRRYFRSLNEEDWAELRELWTADAEVRAVGARPRRGPDEIVEFFSGLFAPWPRHRDEPTRLLIAGDAVTVEVTFTGTTQDGREVSFDAVDVFDVRDGRFSRLTNWYDIAHVRRELAGQTG